MLTKLIFWWGQGKVEKIIQDIRSCYVLWRQGQSPGRWERSGVRKKLTTLNRVFRKDLTEMATVEKRLEGTLRGSHADTLQRRNSRYEGPKVEVHKVCSMISKEVIWVDQSNGLRRKEGPLLSLGASEIILRPVLLLWVKWWASEDSGTEERHNLAILNRICCCVENSP